MRVATYNIHRAIGTDRRRDTDRVAAVIRELDADIVGLQEVAWRPDSDESQSQFEYLANMLEYHAIEGPNVHDHRGKYGNVLLSRLPVRAVRRIDLRQPGCEPRGAIDAELEGGLRVIVTHLGLRLWERQRQVEMLREVLLAARPSPSLLLGDLNDWLPGSPTLRPLAALCGRTDRIPSFPSRLPVLPLDRVFACDLDVREIGVHRSQLSRRASDHLPVVATIG